VKNAAPSAKYGRVTVEELCGQYLVGDEGRKRERESSGLDRQL
jgi:hypothetical protein